MNTAPPPVPPHPSTYEAGAGWQMPQPHMPHVAYAPPPLHPQSVPPPSQHPAEAPAHSQYPATVTPQQQQSHPSAELNDPRPAHLWEFCNSVNDFIPWKAADIMHWGHELNQIEWELDARKTTSKTKMMITKGPTGTAPVAYTYTKFTQHLKSVSGNDKLDSHISTKLDKKSNVQTCSVKSNRKHFPELLWRSNGIMSTVNGNTPDTTRYWLMDKKSNTELATMSWLQEDGEFDLCLHISPLAPKMGVPEDIILISLLIFANDQWKVMLSEAQSTELLARIPTLELVRDTMDQVPGRRYLYEFDNAEEVNECINTIRQNHYRKVQQRYETAAACNEFSQQMNNLSQAISSM